MKGIYLLDAHKIISGEKTAIPTHIKRDLEGEHILLVKTNTGPVAAGVVLMGPPAQVSTKEFDANIDKHCISVSSRLRWWPTNDTLYIYPIIQYVGFEKSVHIDLLPGIGMGVDLTRCSNVKLCTVLSDGVTCGVPIEEEEHGTN